MGHFILHWLGLDSGSSPVYLLLSGFLGCAIFGSGFVAHLRQAARHQAQRLEQAAAHHKATLEQAAAHHEALKEHLTSLTKGGM